MSFSTLPAGGTTWYPAAGFRRRSDGALSSVGSYGYCWSCTVYNTNAYYLYFSDSGYVGPSDSNYRAIGRSVRCLSE